MPAGNVLLRGVVQVGANIDPALKQVDTLLNSLTAQIKNFNSKTAGVDLKKMGKTLNALQNAQGSIVSSVKQEAKVRKSILGTIAGQAKEFGLLVARQAVYAAVWTAIYGSIQRVNNVLRESVELFKEFEVGAARALRTGLSSEQVAGAFSGGDLQKLVTQYREVATVQGLLFTSKHTSNAEQYMSALYELTSANIAFGKATGFANDAMKLTIAAEGDIVQTTRTLAGLYNIFGDRMGRLGSEQEKFSEISNVVLYTWGKEAVELAELNSALKYSAASARAMDMDYRDLVATLGHLNTMLVKGSTAGTGFRQMMNGMQKNLGKMSTAFSKDFGEAMKSSNEKYRDAFDVNKPLKFMRVIEGLRMQLKAVGDVAADGNIQFNTDQMKILTQLFNLRGANVAATLLRTYDQLEGKLNTVKNLQSDYIDDFVRLQELNLASQFEIFVRNLKMVPAAFLLGVESEKDMAKALESLNEQFEGLIVQFYKFGKQGQIVWTEMAKGIEHSMPLLMEIYLETKKWVGSISDVISLVSTLASTIYTLVSPIVAVLGFFKDMTDTAMDTGVLVLGTFLNLLKFIPDMGKLGIQGAYEELLRSLRLLTFDWLNDIFGMDGMFYKYFIKILEVMAKAHVISLEDVLKAKESWQTGLDSLNEKGPLGKTVSISEDWEEILNNISSSVDAIGKGFNNIASEMAGVKSGAEQIYESMKKMGFPGWSNNDQKKIEMKRKHEEEWRAYEEMLYRSDDKMMKAEDGLKSAQEFRKTTKASTAFMSPLASKESMRVADQVYDSAVVQYQRAYNEMYEVYKVYGKLTEKQALETNNMKLKIERDFNELLMNEEEKKISGIKAKWTDLWVMYSQEPEKQAKILKAMGKELYEQQIKDEQWFQGIFMGQKEKGYQDIIVKYQGYLKRVEGNVAKEREIYHKMADELKEYQIKVASETAQAILDIRQNLLKDLIEKGKLELAYIQQQEINKLEAQRVAELSKPGLSKEEIDRINSRFDAAKKVLKGEQSIEEALRSQAEIQSELAMLEEKRALAVERVVKTYKAYMSNPTDANASIYLAESQKLKDIDNQILNLKMGMEKAKTSELEARAGIYTSIGTEEDPTNKAAMKETQTNVSNPTAPVYDSQGNQVPRSEQGYERSNNWSPDDQSAAPPTAKQVGYMGGNQPMDTNMGGGSWAKATLDDPNAGSVSAYTKATSEIISAGRDVFALESMGLKKLEALRNNRLRQLNAELSVHKELKNIQRFGENINLGKLNHTGRAFANAGTQLPTASKGNYDDNQLKRLDNAILHKSGGPPQLHFHINGRERQGINSGNLDPGLRNQVSGVASALLSAAENMFGSI